MTRQIRNVGILFADISGSMRLYEAIGNRGAHAAIEICLGLLSQIIADNRGTVVKTIGDEIMGCFDEPSDVWAAAVAAQRRIDGLPPIPSPQGPIKQGLRVGLSFGQAIATAGDYFGDSVNVAARMVQLAKRGQIITTAGDQALLPAAHAFQTRRLDWLGVKGKPDGVQVVEVMWQTANPGHHTVVDLAGFGGAPRGPASDLRLSLGPRSWMHDGRLPTISIGRDETNDIVLTGICVSRSHATLERRRERWILIDHSSNGTFMATPGERDIHLRHEEFTLGREGLIGFGQPTGQNLPECMRFAVGPRAV